MRRNPGTNCFPIEYTDLGLPNAFVCRRSGRDMRGARRISFAQNTAMIQNRIRLNYAHT
jgi:hypothetical protein